MNFFSNVRAMQGRNDVGQVKKSRMHLFCLLFFALGITGCSGDGTLYLSPGYAQENSQVSQSAQVQQQELESDQGQFAIEPPEVNKKTVEIADEKVKEYIIGTWSSNYSNYSYSVTKVNGNVIQSTNTAVLTTRTTLVFNADKTMVFKTEVGQPTGGIIKKSESSGNWEIKNSQLYMKMNAQGNMDSFNLVADLVWLNQDSFVMKYDPASYIKMLEDTLAKTQYPAGATYNNKFRYYHAASGFSYNIMQMQVIQPNGHIAESTTVFKTERMLYSKEQQQSAVWQGTPIVPVIPAANNVAFPNNQLNQLQTQQSAPQPQMQQSEVQPQIQNPQPPRKKPEPIARPFYALGRIVCSPLNIIGITSTECKKINSDMAFMYAFVPVITVPAGVLAMSGDVVVGCLELLTFQAFDVRYPWESFKPSKSQGEIIKFTKSLLSIATVAAAYGAANYASTYSAVKAANASTPPPTSSYSGGSSSKGASSAVLNNKEERRECNVCHTKYWGASCPSCKYRINYH